MRFARKPAPEALDRHQVGLWPDNVNEVTVQAGSGGADGPGAVIGGAIPDHDEPSLGNLGTQPA